MVQVASYHPSWVRAFEEEHERIDRVAGDLFLHLHHIGSTSVAGLAAKPVIDLMMTVYDFSGEERLEKALETLGYEAKGAYGIEGRRFFTKRGEEPSHHLHVFVDGDPHVLRHLAFRDYLKAHPEVATVYGKLKRDLALRHPADIDAYCEGKKSWILRTEKLALDWSEAQVRALIVPLVAEEEPLPAGREAVALAERLLPHIGSLDPELRDGMVYPVVGTMIQRRLFPDAWLPELTRRLCGTGYLWYRLGEGEEDSVFRRSFSLLLLTEIIELESRVGLLDADQERALVEAVVGYFEGEVDRRGYDTVCGWAHSIAHAGDAIGALSGLEVLSEGDVDRLLAAVSLHFSNETRVLINEESERIVSGLLRLQGAGKRDVIVLRRWVETFEGLPDAETYPQRQYREENIKRLLGSLYFRLDPDVHRDLRGAIEGVIKKRSHF